MIPHCHESRLRQDAQLRLFLFTPAGFDPDFDDVEEAVEDVLSGVDVLNTREGDVALVAEDMKTPNHTLQQTWPLRSGCNPRRLICLSRLASGILNGAFCFGAA